MSLDNCVLPTQCEVFPKPMLYYIIKTQQPDIHLSFLSQTEMF